MSAKDQKNYWKSRVRKRKYLRDGKESLSKEYYAILQWGGKRKWIPLGTANQDNAASVAASRYVELMEGGWNALAKKAGNDNSDLTAGEFLQRIESVSKVSARTWGNYSKCFRQIVGDIQGFKSPKGAKFDWDAYKIWIKKVNNSKIAVLSRESISKWTKQYVAQRNPAADAARKTRTSCNTILRNAKALFNAELLDLADMNDLENPFHGVKGYPAERNRYKSNFEAQDLLEEAEKTLDRPKEEKENKHAYLRRKEAFKALILFGFTAVRRKEADLLMWSQINFEEGFIDIRRTRYFEPKSESAVARIPLDDDAIAILRGFREKDPKGEFVLRGSQPGSVTTRSTYRCNKTFKFLIAWLRKYKNASGAQPFVDVQKPLHEIRKEIGALLASHHGIFAAQRFLRHAEIATTERYYSDQKDKITAGLKLNKLPEGES